MPNSAFVGEMEETELVMEATLLNSLPLPTSVGFPGYFAALNAAYCGSSGAHPPAGKPLAAKLAALADSTFFCFNKNWLKRFGS